MSMSRDRVHFELDTSSMNSAVRTAFKRAFGCAPPAYGPVYSGERPMARIICRPSQFARFLIYRNDEGGRNGFKELNAVLVPAESQPPILDVSGNPAG